MAFLHPRPSRISNLVLLASILAAADARAAARLHLHESSLTLPGAPVSMVATDLDRDGRQDLAIFVVGSRWGEKVTWDRSEMDDVEGLVEVMTVVPTLLDRRELWLYRGDGEGGLRAAGPPVEMPLSIHALGKGSGAYPLLALTDEGVSAVAWDPESGSAEARLESLVESPTILSGTGAFVPSLELTADLDGDGYPELMLPAPDGIRIYPGTSDGFETVAAVQGLAPPPEPAGVTGAPTLSYPLPSVADVTGDGTPDLVWRDPRHGWARPWVAVGGPGVAFAPPRAVFPGASLDPKAEPLTGLASVPADPDAADEVDALHYGDLDGDGAAELVVVVMDPEPDDLGMRDSIHWAESPPGKAFVHATHGGFEPSVDPRVSFPIHGYANTGSDDSDFELPGGFLDLDGDGRLDLVTLSLKISITKLLGGLALGRVTLPMDFHVWCQDTQGGFRPVSGLDLSGKFRVDIGDLKVRNIPSFAGDFDGDGRRDFVQLGRGTKVTIHTGGPGCSFPARPDLTLRLKKEPAHMELVRVRDLDGDGRSDLVVIHPLERREPGALPPTRVDLYLSGGEE